MEKGRDGEVDNRQSTIDREVSLAMASKASPQKRKRIKNRK